MEAKSMTPNCRTKNSNLFDADLCRKNGWGAGTVLEGEDGFGSRGLERIEITAVGEDNILAKSLPDGEDERLVCLTLREWTEVKA